MSVAYHAVLQAIAAVLAAGTETAGTHIVVEQDPDFAQMDSGKGIGIFMLNRRAAASQSLAAGKRVRYVLRFSVSCFGFDLESFDKAAQKRDSLLAAVELVLMRDPSLQQTVTSSWLEGGDFVSARGSAGSPFIAAADTILVADVSAINQ